MSEGPELISVARDPLTADMFDLHQFTKPIPIRTALAMVLT